MRNGPEPDRSKPCWVLFDRGLTHMTKVNGKALRGHKISVAEYAWIDGAWRRTETPEVWPKSVYDAFTLANWIGRLPKMGRKKKTVLQEDKTTIRRYYAENITKF